MQEQKFYMVPKVALFQTFQRWHKETIDPLSSEKTTGWKA